MVTAVRFVSLASGCTNMRCFAKLWHSCGPYGHSWRRFIRGQMPFLSHSQWY